MNYHAIGSTGLSVSERGLGTWNLTDKFWGHQERADSIKVIETALSAGINHIDTAAMYGNGASEKLVYEQIHDIREKFVIASKCVADPLPQFQKTFELSLQRLGTEYLDILYIHWPRKKVDPRPLVEAMARWREEGKIRAIGVSNFQKEELELAMEAGKIDLHQIGYNLIWRIEEARTIPFCQQHEIALVYYSPLAHGLLTGKFNNAKTLFENDPYRSLAVFTYPHIWPQVRGTLVRMTERSGQEGATLAQTALQWLAGRHGAVCTLVGCRNERQARENCFPSSAPLSDETLSLFSQLSDSLLPLMEPYPNMFNFHGFPREKQ